MAPEALDTSCPMAGCGGPTYWRRDGYRVCMHCGHELAAHDALPSAEVSNVRSATRAVSSSGLIVAALVAGSIVFSLASSAHPELAHPTPVREAAISDGNLVEILRRGQAGLGGDENLMPLLRIKNIEALITTDPATVRSANTIANDWVHYHAETKRQIALVLHDLACQSNKAAYRSVQLSVTLLVGEILIAGVELEPRALERLIESFYFYGEDYGHDLLRAVGRVVQRYAPPEPRLQDQLRKFLLDP